MLHVVVDTTQPYMQDHRGAGAAGRREGAGRGDQLGSRRPEPDAQSGQPGVVARRQGDEVERDQVSAEQYLANATGRYTWEVPDPDLWKFYIRIRAVDHASNTGEHIWAGDSTDRNKPPQEVIVDLVNPTGGIKGVRGGNMPAGSGNAPSGGGTSPGGGSSPSKRPGGSDDPPSGAGKPGGVGPDLPKLPDYP